MVHVSGRNSFPDKKPELFNQFTEYLNSDEVSRSSRRNVFNSVGKDKELAILCCKIQVSFVFNVLLL